MSEKLELKNFVGGEHTDTTDGRRMDLVDPSTGEVFASAPVSSAEDVDRAYRVAADAFETWRDTTPSERQQALLKFADAVEEHAEELVALESRNTGKPIGLTTSEEIPPMVDQIRFFAGAARTLEGKAAAEYMAGHTSWIRREPIGVVGQVTPWNYPMMMAIWKIAPALAAGNTVVLKPSDTTPVTTLRLAEQAKGATTTYGRPADDEDAWVPPVNNVNQMQRVLSFFSDVPSHAKVAVGGNRQGDKGFYVEPTVIGGLLQDDRLVQQEIFGPVITVQSFADEEQALTWANGVEYALASSVWTKDVSRALRVSNALDFGCVWINTHIPLVAEMPHGGYKSSGHGKDLSMYGLEDYTRIKHVMAYTG